MMTGHVLHAKCESRITAHLCASVRSCSECSINVVFNRAAVPAARHEILYEARMNARVNTQPWGGRSMAVGCDLSTQSESCRHVSGCFGWHNTPFQSRFCSCALYMVGFGDYC